MAYAWPYRVAVFAEGKILIEDTPYKLFGMENFGERTDLRLPLVYQLGKGLTALGLMPGQDSMPRGVDELLKCISAPNDSRHS